MNTLEFSAVPKEIHDAERLLHRYFSEHNIRNWKLGDCMSRNHDCDTPKDSPRYLIAAGENIMSMIAEVQRLLDDGYQPIGGIAYHRDQRGDESYLQAMLKL